ncbi:MAG TPA: tetratricopeptide repeat protein [Saprospiraceae bacterium]|nr:tetratricopeptide repeat protein [Saprospiraceae bacterium]
MTNPAILYQHTVKRLELKLEKQTDPEQRMVLLDQLANQYVYTDVRKAQLHLDELEEILKHIVNDDIKLNKLINTALVENQLYNFILAERHFEKAFEMLEDRGGIKQQAEAYIDYTSVCINQKKLELALEYLEKARKLLKRFPDDRLSARISCREGFVNLHYENYSLAISFLLKAEKQISLLPRPLSLKDQYFLTLVYSGLGNVYANNNDPDRSVNAYLRVLDICKAINLRTRLSWHYLHVGSAYLSLFDYKKAEQYFYKAIKIDDDISQLARANAMANLGYCRFVKKKYKDALSLYDRAYHLFLEKGESKNLFNIERWRAEVYGALNDNEKVKDHLLQAFDYANMRKDVHQLSIIFRDIAEFYASMGEYEQAYLYKQSQIKAEEKAQSKTNKRRIMELQFQYDAEKKKRETERLKLEATKLQLKALRAQMNPHFMYNALNSIQHFIATNNSDAANKYLAKFSELMRQSLMHSEEEIISLEQEIDFLRNYLEINKKLRFDDNLNFEIVVDEDVEDDIFGVPTMIVQPYVENAIEHGLRSVKDGWIWLKFSMKNENTVLCTIEDNGIGRKKAKELQAKDPKRIKHRSMGTSITEKRLQILHETETQGLLVETIDLFDELTGEAKGTKVLIQIPIVEI